MVSSYIFRLFSIDFHKHCYSRLMHRLSSSRTIYLYIYSTHKRIRRYTIHNRRVAKAFHQRHYSSVRNSSKCRIYMAGVPAPYVVPASLLLLCSFIDCYENDNFYSFIHEIRVGHEYLNLWCVQRRTYMVYNMYYCGIPVPATSVPPMNISGEKLLF